jgi:ParB-like chromosome segregation protein Spo0J
VLVLATKSGAVVLDGHHRVIAYEREGCPDVPVEWFDGSLKDAIAVAGQANSKTKLALTCRQRQDFAWKLVLLGLHSKKQIVEASGIGDGQVARMRRVKKQLGSEGFTTSGWHHAQALSEKGQAPSEMSDEMREAWMDDKATTAAEKLHKAFGSSFAESPEIAARALVLYFGHRLEGLIEELNHLAPSDDEDENYEF